MPFPLNNFTTTNAYSSSGEVVFSPPRSSCSMIVTNAAIYYQLAPMVFDAHALAASYNPEVYAPPGRYSFDETDFQPGGKVALINVRSAVSGLPAQVSIT